MFTEPKIAPSILSADFMNMARDVAEIEEGGAAFVHVDVMDGHFVPNLTLGVPFVAGLKKITTLPLDVHLMISNPLEQLPWYLEHTPDIVTVHAEALNADAGQFDLAIDMIHDAGCKAAIAMKPDCDVELIKPYIAKLDMVLPMSVFPGFSGQSYIQGTEAKVARIVEMAREAGVSPLIEVDGGLKANDPTRAVCAAGCDVLVAGSGVFGASDRAAAIAEMKAVAEEFGRGVLRGLTVKELLARAGELREKVGDRAILRAFHFIRENERVMGQAEALKRGDIGSFLRGVRASGESSFMYLQNVYTTKNVREQGLSLALAVTDYALSGTERTSAWRVHGGGFAGTVQAFVPDENVDGYKSGMEAVFGAGSCAVLKVRPEGCTAVL